MLNYEKIKKTIIKKNIELVIKQYKLPDVQEKIVKYANKFGIDKTKIEESIKKRDLITLSIFAKDPSKQNFYENIVAECIKKIDGSKIVNLPPIEAKMLYMLIKITFVKKWLCRWITR